MIFADSSRLAQASSASGMALADPIRRGGLARRPGVSSVSRVTPEPSRARSASSRAVGGAGEALGGGGRVSGASRARRASPLGFPRGASRSIVFVTARVPTHPSRLLVAPRTRRLARRWTAAPPRAPRADPGGVPPTPPRARRPPETLARACATPGRVPRRVRSNAPSGGAGPGEDGVASAPSPPGTTEPRPDPRGPLEASAASAARVVAPAPARAPRPSPRGRGRPGTARCSRSRTRGSAARTSRRP